MIMLNYQRVGLINGFWATHGQKHGENRDQYGGILSCLIQWE